MREDFSKVVNDKPRRRSSEPSKKTRARLDPREFEGNWYDPDTGPRKLSSGKRRQYGYDCRYHNTNTAPLMGFLRKNLNRPWDKVYSEFCVRIDPRTKTGDNIKKTLRRLVTSDCFEGDHKLVYENVQHSWETEPRLVSGYYVHPRTGLLKYQDSEGVHIDPRIWLSTHINELKVDDRCSYVLYGDTGLSPWPRPSTWRKPGWWKITTAIADKDIETWTIELGRISVKKGQLYGINNRPATAKELRRIEELLEQEKQYILRTGQRKISGWTNRW